jgi:hypothetical protein
LHDLGRGIRLKVIGNSHLCRQRGSEGLAFPAMRIRFSAHRRRRQVTLIHRIHQHAGLTFGWWGRGWTSRPVCGGGLIRLCAGLVLLALLDPIYCRLQFLPVG